MLPLGRKPVVQLVAEELAAVGVRRILFITGPGKTSIEDHLGTDLGLNVRYAYTRQGQPLGLGHAVLCARPFVGDEPFAVALGDSVLGLHARSQVVAWLVEELTRSGAHGVIAFDEIPREQVVGYGVARPKETAGAVFELADLVEKPAVALAPSNLVVAARYVFTPSIFDCLARTPPGKGGEIQLTDAVRLLIREGGKVLGARLGPADRRYDVGTFDGYFRAFCDFALADEHHGPALRDHLCSLLGSPSAGGL
jgi:UTP--glucose-1-phosphate uridylyltransferase